MLPARCSMFVFSVLLLLLFSGLHGCDALSEAAGRAKASSRMHLRSSGSGVVEEQQDSGKAVASEPAPAPAPGPASAPAAAPGPAPAPAAQGVATTLSVDAPAGATTIEVASTEGFGVGDTIIIGNVSSGEVETKAVIGFGSLILDSPLAKAYPAGTAVTVAAFLTGPLPTTSSTTLNPVAQTVAEMDEMVEAEKAVLNPTDPLSILKEQLSANVWLQEALEEKKDSLKEEVYRAKLANDVEAVARETTPGVAQMLGDMRRQMHSLAAPFYEKAVEGQIKDLKAREKSLLEQIAAAEAGPESTTPPPVKKEAEEKVEVAAEEPEPAANSETRRLWVICFIILLGMAAICCVLSMRRRRNTPDA